MKYCVTRTNPCIETPSRGCQATVVVAVAFAISMLLTGCRDKQSGENAPAVNLVAQHPSGPTNFIHQIAKTDRIVVAFRWPEKMPSFNGYTLKMSGNEMRKVLLAVASLQSDRGPSRSACDWQLQFFQGSTLLGRANFQDGIVRLDKDYHDTSGVLSNLYERVQSEASSH